VNNETNQFVFRLLSSMVQNQTHIHNANQNNQIATKMGRGKGADAKPRGRMTAYAFFVQTCREEHKKKHPEESVIFAEFSRKCAERWKVRNG
jgi:high mobility group protein B1